jgi:hypothetical protein
MNPVLKDNDLCLMGLQADSITLYSFYSFPYPLQFRGKRYHWYQSLDSSWRIQNRGFSIANYRSVA